MRAASLILVVLLIGSATTTLAQTPATTQGALLKNGGRTTLSMALFTYGGYDVGSVQRTVGARTSHFEREGFYAGGNAGLTFSQPVGRFSMSGSGSTDIRHYNDGTMSGFTGHSTGGGLTIGGPIARYSTIRFVQGISASSYYQFNPFSGLTVRSAEELAIPSADYRLENGRTVSYDAGAGVDSRLSQYTTLNLDYRFRYSTFPTENLELHSNSASFRLDHRVTRALSFRAGYGYERGESQSGVDPFQVHRLDTGIAYGSRLPFSRRTSFSFTSGLAILTGRDETTLDATAVPQLLVNTSLRHEIGRTWAISGEYRREPLVVDLFRSPTYGDVVAGGARGAVSRRVNLVFSGGYARYALDAGTSPQGTRSTFGSARTNVAVSRMLAVYVEYAYYNFDNDVLLKSGRISSQVGRHAFRAGVSSSLPLMKPRP